jgi:DNA-binding MarR family transcriptional regulator
VLEYLNDILGFDVKSEAWVGEKSLPLYLRKGRGFFVLSFDDVKCLLLSIHDDSFSLNSLQKQMKKIEDNAPGPVVLCFAHLTSYQRKALIENRVPFIVPDSQVYLPFMGVFLKERMKSSEKQVEKMTAMSQQVFLYLMYHRVVQPISKVDLSKVLHVSAMSITRAVKELEMNDLVIEAKNGSSDAVSLSDDPVHLYERAEPFLINPVIKRVVVKNDAQVILLPLAGESALSAQSMLNPPGMQCRAVSRHIFKTMENLMVVNPDWDRVNDCCELEVWKYDPNVLCQNGMVDPLSLILSLKEEEDERVEIAVMEFREGLQW